MITRCRGELQVDLTPSMRSYRFGGGLVNSIGIKTMTSLQKTQLRLSKVRERLNEISGLADDDVTAEVRSEAEKLHDEYGALEVKFRAGLAAESEIEERASREFGDGESAEMRSLLHRASVGGYLEHAINGSAVDGAERELNAALQVRETGAVRIPWAALEVRVDAVTDTGALGGGTRQRPILQRLFGRDIMAAMGVRIDSVPDGMSEWPLLTGGAAPAQVAEKGKKDAAAATFQTQALKPKRMTGRYVWTAEQTAQVAGLEAALRKDLGDSVRAQMSEQVIAGDGNAPQVTGFLTRLAAPQNPAAVAGYADYAAMAAAAVDGIHAEMESEVGVVLGVETYQHAARQIQAGSGDAATDAIKRRARACRASSFIPQAAANVQTALMHAGADEMRGDSIAAMWPALEVVRDIYTGAAQGEVALTWIVLWDCYTAFRADAYKRVAFKLA